MPRPRVGSGAFRTPHSEFPVRGAGEKLDGGQGEDQAHVKEEPEPDPPHEPAQPGPAPEVEDENHDPEDEA